MAEDHFEPPTAFVSVPTGRGDVIDIPYYVASAGAAEHQLRVTWLTRVGTFGCSSCVGLYIPLNDSMCYVAHIMARKSRGKWNEEKQEFDDPASELMINDGEAEKLKHFIKDEINKIAGFDGSVWPRREEYRKRVILVCPYRYHPTSDKVFTGDAVVKGVQESLGLEQSSYKPDKEGIVVKHGTDEATLIDFVREDVDETENLWKHNLEKVEIEATELSMWKIELDKDGKWQFQNRLFPWQRRS